MDRIEPLRKALNDLFHCFRIEVRKVDETAANNTFMVQKLNISLLKQGTVFLLTFPYFASHLLSSFNVKDKQGSY